MDQAQAQETAEGLVLCDQCSARAQVEVGLLTGKLTFCLHHYNKNAEVLTNKGAVAKLLNI
jgi:hypothetical protein